jgi:hypothetical protein
MAITFRNEKGTALTYGEMDENFRDLRFDTNIDRVLQNGNTSNLSMTVESIQANFVNVQSVGVTSMNTLKLGVGNPSPNHQSIVDITTTRQYGNVNINYEESTVQIHGNADEYPRVEIYAHGLNGSLETYESSELILLKSRGIKTEPTQTISGDTVGTLIARGWNNSINGYTTVSQIRFLQTGNTTPSGTPGALLFETNDGSQGQFGSVERMRITSAGNVGIGTSAPDASALLDVTSTTGGILFPRMTSTQRDAIGSPANGLVLYNTTTNKLQVRAGGSWVDLH